ncbi:MAG: PstS family phosphate ABC transporter substrate-binding protein [Chlorobium sp.]
MSLLFSGFFLLNCTQRQDEESARSGRMTLAVDQQLADIARTQSGMFSSYYPEAQITLMPVKSNNTLKLLLDRSVRAALIDGETVAAEDSLFAKLSHPLRREPIALDALVCIVNSKNPLKTISVEELGALFSAPGKNGVTPLIEDDFRLRSLLAAKTGIKGSDLRAWRCGSNSELIMRVSADNNAVGLLFRSSLDKALHSEHEPQNTRILLLSGKSGNTPACLPTQQNMFEGNYPLVTTLYYVYYPGDALAAGFGAWLGSSGQKVFERSSFAPFRLVERTIILK